MSLVMQQVDEKGIDKILSNAPGDPRRAQAMDKIMLPWLPYWRRVQTERPAARPIEGMTQRAAEGLVQAAEAGLIDGRSWLQLVGVWDQVVATAE